MNESAPSQSSDRTAPAISAVVPAYNESGNLPELYRRVRDVLDGLGRSWEIVFADDGSVDATWATIRELSGRDCRVRGVRLSRNFGHQYALWAGLRHARGRAVITLDADLQHPPELIPELVAAWDAGARIVHTVRRDGRHVSRFKAATSRLYYRLYSRLSGVDIDPGMADYRLLDRSVVDGLAQFQEDGLFLRGLVQWVGFPSAKIPFECGERFSGTSKYTLRKMLRLAWHGISSFSNVPLRLAIGLGIFTSGLAFLELVYAVTARLFWGHTVPGWASAVSLVSLLFGILFILLGILGEYIGRILIEVRARPRYLVAEVTDGDIQTDRL
jgi:glycosyltransferase involved in cell wall biosynthesis